MGWQSGAPSIHGPRVCTSPMPRTHWRREEARNGEKGNRKATVLSLPTAFHYGLVVATGEGGWGMVLNADDRHNPCSWEPTFVISAN